MCLHRRGRASATDSQVSERGNAIVPLARDLDRHARSWRRCTNGYSTLDAARASSNDHITSSLDLDAALDAIELIGLALAVMPVPPDADRAEIRLEGLQLAEHLLERGHRRPPWRSRS